MENRLKCPVGYIYALYYNNKPFYIGQTKDNVKKRLSLHKYKAFKSKRDTNVLLFIRSICNVDNFNEVISIRPLKIVTHYELKYQEAQVIKYCIDRGLKIYNSCTITNSYKYK